jgi:SAM-dependent methyltransferase
VTDPGQPDVTAASVPDVEPDAPPAIGPLAPRPSKLPPVAAGAIVFVSSAAVLMLEILAGRLLAPYVGISLQTYTSIIGTVLAGIALGAWAGGKLADRFDPHRTIGPVVAAGGVLAFCTVPIIRELGGSVGDATSPSTLTLSFAAFFLPAAVLSAVTPMVVKLQLQSLASTGGVVGRLSGISTAGALVGTFVTGYVLVATTPTRTIIALIGTVLVVLGLALTAWLWRRELPLAVVTVVVVGLAAGGFAWSATSTEPCQVESAYYCLRVEKDPFRASGRTLWLDDVRHSYVDLDDPKYLGFEYQRSFVDAVDSAFPGKGAIDALHVGGGGFTYPRYLAATRPGTRSLVLEIDPAVLDLGRDELGLRTSDALRVRIGDARTGIRRLAADSRDVIVGDAFGSLSVPWHLTTRQFLGEVDRVLRPDGIYVQNVIDDPPFRFARAQLATLRERFEHVAAIAPAAVFDGQSGDNVVLVASHRPFDSTDLDERVRARGFELVEGRALDRFVGDAPVIDDDHAPIDQWLRQDSVS